MLSISSLSPSSFTLLRRRVEYSGQRPPNPHANVPPTKHKGTLAPGQLVQVGEHIVRLSEGHSRADLAVSDPNMAGTDVDLGLKHWVDMEHLAVLEAAGRTPTKHKGTLAPGQLVQVGEHIVRVERYLSEGGYAHVYLTTSEKPIYPPAKQSKGRWGERGMLSISSLSPSSFTLLRRRVDRLLRGCQVDMRITMST
jgi:hypothetical protein